jgi:peptidoglycan/LPS O-acetylase OafA/YrhL
MMASQPRYGALDGLRGVAALIVVVHHGFLTSGVLARAYHSGGEATGWPAVLTFTPLHSFWAGNEAVILFFVLSGVVLTLPRMKTQPEPWLAYYPKRLIRLYLPTIAAVGLSVLIVAIVGRRTDLDSWWMNMHTLPSFRQALHDTTLVAGTMKLNSALWSLEGEVWFSLLLPIYLWVAMATRRLGFMVGFLAIAAAIVVGRETGISYLIYMPVFGVGVLIALHLDKLSRICNRLLKSQLAVVTAVALAVIAFSTHWWVTGLGAGLRFANVAGTLGTLGGSAILIVMAMRVDSVANFLQLPAIKWLGTRSFSLYLIHEPIVVSIGTWLPNRDNPALVTSLGISASLLCAEIFCRLIEQPSHRLARRVGRSVAERSGRARTRASSPPSSVD